MERDQLAAKDNGGRQKCKGSLHECQGGRKSPWMAFGFGFKKINRWRSQFWRRTRLLAVVVELDGGRVASEVKGDRRSD